MNGVHARTRCVTTLHEHGGFALMLQALAGLCVLVIIGAILFPPEKRQQL